MRFSVLEQVEAHPFLQAEKMQNIEVYEMNFQGNRVNSIFKTHHDIIFFWNNGKINKTHASKAYQISKSV